MPTKLRGEPAAATAGTMLQQKWSTLTCRRELMLLFGEIREGKTLSECTSSPQHRRNAQPWMFS